MLLGMDGISYYAAAESLKVGDLVSLGSFPVPRKWWQIWKPRYSLEQRVFRSAEGKARIAPSERRIRDCCNPDRVVVTIRPSEWPGPKDRFEF